MKAKLVRLIIDTHNEPSTERQEEKETNKN